MSYQSNQLGQHLKLAVDSLPYSYNQEAKKRILEDVNGLLEIHNTFQCSVHHPPPELQMSSELKFMLDGTVPVEIGQCTYNIPITVFLDNKYPQAYPRVLVNPTSSMYIAPNHKHVCAKTRICYCQYITDWSQNPKNCNLLELIFTLQEIFKAQPPLYQKSNQPPPPVPQPYPSQPYNVNAYPQYTPAPQPQYPQHTPPPPKPSFPGPTPGMATGPTKGPDADDGNNCVICMDARRDTVFIPCRHLVTCQKCAGGLKECPVCRKNVTDKLTVFCP